MTQRVSLTAYATAYKTYNTLVNKPWQDKQSVVGDTRGESVDTRYSRSQHQLWSHKRTRNKSPLCIYITRLDSQSIPIRDTDVDRMLTPYLWISTELRVHTNTLVHVVSIWHFINGAIGVDQIRFRLRVEMLGLGPGNFTNQIPLTFLNYVGNYQLISEECQEITHSNVGDMADFTWML